MIVGLLDQSSGLEDILVNEDSRIWVKRTGSPFEQVGEFAQPTGARGDDDDCVHAKDDGYGDAASSGIAASHLEVPLCRID